MNHDLALIASVLEEKELREALQLGVTEDLLGDGDARAYWSLLIDYWEKHHDVPSLSMFTSWCPEYEHVTPEDPLSAIVEYLKTQALGNALEEGLERIVNTNLVDPWEAKEQAALLVEDLLLKHQTTTSDYRLGDGDEDFVERLKERRDQKGLMGLPWPWECWNALTIGLCPGHLYYLYGRHKSKKTWILIFMALFYWSIGRRVLFFTREMPVDELKERTYCLAGQFGYIEFIKGKLTNAGFAELGMIIEEMATSRNFIFTDVGGGLPEFQAKIEEYKPDIVFHDSFKHMADHMMGTRVNQEHRYVGQVITRAKEFAMKRAKVPIIFAGHANREGAKSKGRSSTEHAWSDEIPKRVDGALRVINNKSENRIGIYVNAGRSMPEGIGVTIDGTLCQGFGTLLESNAAWTKDYSENEDEGVAQNPGAPHSTQPKAGKSPLGGQVNIPNRLGAKSFKRSFRRK